MSPMRLLFDENLPWRVAEALRVLGFDVSYVGRDEDGSAKRGSPDSIVLAEAQRINRIVVTSNYDMILLCIEKEESVIWIDPYRRDIRRNEMVVLAFNAIPEWEEMLANVSGPVVIRTLRTKIESLDLKDAKHLVQACMKGIRARKPRTTKAKKKAKQGEQLPLE